MFIYSQKSFNIFCYKAGRLLFSQYTAHFKKEFSAIIFNPQSRRILRDNRKALAWKSASQNVKLW